MENRQENIETPKRMPALFVGHGSPTNALPDSEFGAIWAEVGRALPRPEAIVCISAHWETEGTYVTSMEQPDTIYDFEGFPPELYQITYPAPGSREYAMVVKESVGATMVELCEEGGLDHGAWCVLSRMFPDADIPVIQLSLNSNLDVVFHYNLGRELAKLRKHGVMLIGSGNIVHNLREVVWEETAYDWAESFDRTIKQMITRRDHPGIINYHQLGKPARLSVPTPEHFLPLLYILATQNNEDRVSFFAERVTLGSISMTSFILG